MNFRFIKILSIFSFSILLLLNCLKKNHPPLTPDTPLGRSIGAANVNYSFSIGPIDPDEDSVAVRCLWGDGDTSDWSQFQGSGKIILLSHSWSIAGTYYVKAQVEDIKGALSNWSEPCSIRIIIDKPPMTPTMPAGPAEGRINITYDFTSSSTDPDGDKISIRFDWGNGDTSDWSLLQSSGDTINNSYKWLTPETYHIRTQAKDIYDMTSDWSEGLPVLITNLGTLKWRYHTSDYREIRSSPAIGSDGTIYFGSLNDTLYALNQDGTLKWSYSTNGDIYSSPAIGPDGTIYFGSYDNYLYALNPDGSLKWRYDAGTSIHTSPAIGQDGTIYFGQIYGEYHHGEFTALYPDGTLKWSYPTECDIYSSPAIGQDGTIYFGTFSMENETYLYALNPDGSIKWFYPTPNMRSSPTIGPDGTIYYESYALNPDGTIKWICQVPFYSPAIGSDGTIYGGGFSNFFAINPDGTEKWRYSDPISGGAYSPPLIGSDCTVYFGGGVGGGGGLCALNLDGILKWGYFLGNNAIESSPVIGQDGTIYFGAEDGYFYAVQGSGQLADTPWPKFRHDSKNTGRFGGP